MKARSVQLHYRFSVDDADAGQLGDAVQNPLFDLLAALAARGSIQQAALALGLSYRHVWGACKQWEAQLGEPLIQWVQGQPARLTPFAERLLWTEKRARTRLVPHIEALRAELERVLAEARDGSQPVLSVAASHDAALPLLRELVSAHQGLHLELRFAGSMDALRALAEGRCTVAGFHVPPLAHDGTTFARRLMPLLDPRQHRLIGCMQRIQGLMVAQGNPMALQTLADVDLRGARFVSRQPGSGTRLLAEHLLAEQGLQPERMAHWPGHEEWSHLAAATAVAAGAGDVALGPEAAARATGLDFVPLVTENCFLACRAQTVEQPEIQALRATLKHPAWRQTLAGLAGYQPGPCGDVLSLTQALPWWRSHAPGPADLSRQPSGPADQKP